MSVDEQDPNHYREAFHISNPDEEILLTLRGKGNEALKSNNFEIAIATYQKGIDTAKALKHSIAHASFLNNLALAKEGLEQFEDAFAHHFEALTISMEVNFSEGIDNSLTNIGMLSLQLGNFEYGMKSLNTALSIAKENEDYESEKWIRKQMDILFPHLEELNRNDSIN
jgi:tetratricopeptide (TPR) repeat protein